MMLYDLHNKLYYQAINTSKPKMAMSQQGRSWGYVIKRLNGEQTKFWIDFTRGRFMYFEYQGKWYRVQYLQSNYKKNAHDVCQGLMIDLIIDGKELKLVKGNIKKMPLLAM
ncbi:hypothetical protein GFC29_1610 [Anoxybacillus sp. B7M1]|jgi:hypothetical protein|uniref:hypothetical protein n=1 Tax=unclassified Anoxybacillus TaxID=2639704 RepID=UPI0005CCEC0D|nr:MULTISPECIES: hypothetical protein [unclassified Anoxybacillus]ANB56316.1 hypothetical protein GFC28_15 [Anoxybacillus sp. B2M1]ANB62545.1 hypothetical protein GFC29_1610 [Anoxybacillus sp. B7M1]